MRHSLWYRSLVVLWSLWFATALTEPIGALACREHASVGVGAPTGQASGDAAATSYAATADAAMAPSHHAHAGHATPPDVPPPGPSSLTRGPAQDDAPAHSGHPCCTCLGQCCTMAPAELPRDVPVVALVVQSPTHTAPFAQTALAPQRSAYAHPFANGPPLIAL